MLGNNYNSYHSHVLSQLIKHQQDNPFLLQARKKKLLKSKSESYLTVANAIKLSVYEFGCKLLHHCTAVLLFP